MEQCDTEALVPGIRGVGECDCLGLLPELEVVRKEVVVSCVRCVVKDQQNGKGTVGFNSE